ncbi:hypothetical protein ACOMHN_063739 [Nucella lapillus]
MVDKKNNDAQPIIAINTDTQARSRKAGVDNQGFNVLGDVESCVSPAPASPAVASTGRFQKGRANRSHSDAWIDSRKGSVASPSGVFLQKNAMSVESLA